METKEKKEKRIRRHKRVRAKIKGSARCPRLCVFRSNKHIYAQIINDEAGKTLAAAGDLGLEKPLAGKIAIASQVGQLIAQETLKQNIKKVVFDRGGYKYHGRVKALAEGARNNGLEF